MNTVGNTEKRSEAAVKMVMEGQSVYRTAKFLDITPQAVYAALKVRGIDMKSLPDRCDVKRSSVYLLTEVMNVLDAGAVVDGGGRSSRINGVVSRYEMMYSDLVESVCDRFKTDIPRLLDALVVDGGDESWLRGWASDRIDMSGRDIDELPKDMLEVRIIECSDAELVVLEEHLCRKLKKLNAGGHI